MIIKLSSDGKDVESITYDITKDKNQLNIAKAALKANPDLYFEGFSNSAPYFMTKIRLYKPAAGYCKQ